MTDVATLSMVVKSDSVSTGSDRLDNLTKKAGTAEQATDKLSTAFGTLAKAMAVLGIAKVIEQFTKAGDEMALLDARLKLVVSGTQELAQAQSALYNISQSNSSGIRETTQLYIKLADPIKRVGGGIKEVTAVTDAFTKALALGGAGTQEAAAATLQFAQAMGAGKLSGDEFRSIAEASPRLLKAIADGANLPIERLKALGSEGKLTADLIGNALMKQLPLLRREMATFPDTASKSLERLKNDILQAVQAVNSSSGFSTGVAGAFTEMRQLVPIVRDELIGAFSSVSTWLQRNEVEIGQIAGQAKALVADIWEVAKGLVAATAAATGFLAESNAIRTTLETARFLVAGLQDGFNIILSVVSGIYSIMLQIVNFALYGLNEGIKQAAKNAEDLSEGLFQRFKDGRTHTQAVNDDIARINKNTAQIAALGPTIAASYKDMGREGRSWAQEQENSLKKLAANSANDEKAAKAAEKLSKAHQTVMNAISDRMEQEEALKKAMDEGRDYERMVDGQKQVIRLERELEQAKGASAIAYKQEQLAAAQRLTELQMENRDRIALAQATDAWHKILYAGADAYEAERKAAEQNLATYGMTKTQLMGLRVEYLQLELAILKTERAKRGLSGSSLEMEVLQKQISDLSKTISINATIDAKDAAVKAGEAIKTTWADTVSSVDAMFIDGLTTMLDQGEDGFKAFSKSIWRTMQVEFLNKLYQATLRPFVLEIVAGMTGQTNSTTSTLSTSGDAASMLSNVTSAFSSGGSLVNLSTSLASLATTWTKISGTMIQGNALGAAGLEGGRTVTMAAGKAAGTTTTGGSSMMAAAWPLAVIAGMIVSSKLYKQGYGTEEDKNGKMFQMGLGDSKFANIITGAPLASYIHNKLFGGAGFQKQGGSSFYNTQTGGEFDRGYRLYTPNQGDEQLQGTTKGIAETYQNLIRAMGLKAMDFVFGLGFDMDPKGKAGTRLTSQVISGQAGSAKLYENLNQQVGGDMTEAMKLEASRMIISALRNSEVPEEVAKLIDGYGSIASLSQENADKVLDSVQALILFNEAFRGLAYIFPQFTNLTYDAKKALADSFGGLENMVGALATFQQNFYTKAEQTAFTTAQLNTKFAELNVAVPKTKDEFRDLVEAQNLATETGRYTYKELIAISGAFTEVAVEAVKVRHVLDDLIENLMEIDADEISSQLYDAIFSAENAEQAGQNFVQNFQKSFVDQFTNTVIGQVANAVFEGIIMPMATAAVNQASIIATGGTIGGTALALGASEIAAVVNKVQAYLGVVTQIINDPTIKNILSGIAGGLAPVGAGLFTVFNNAGLIPPPKDKDKDKKKEDDDKPGSTTGNTVTTDPLPKIDDWLKGLKNSWRDLKEPSEYQRQLNQINDSYDAGKEEMKKYTATVAQLDEAERALKGIRDEQIAALDKARAAQLEQLMTGIQEDMDSISRTPLAQALKDVDDRYKSQMKTLIELDQVTVANVAKLDAWKKAMQDQAKLTDAVATLNKAYADGKALNTFSAGVKDVIAQAKIANGQLDALSYYDTQIEAAEAHAIAMYQAGSTVDELISEGQTLLGLYQKRMGLVEAEKQTLAKNLELSKSIAAYLGSLKTGDLSILSPEAKLQEAKRQFDEALAAAPTDPAAQGRLQQLTDNALRLNQAYYASGPGYASAYEYFTGKLGAFGLSMSTDAQKQTASLDKIAKINGTSLTKLENLLSMTDLVHDEVEKRGIDALNIIGALGQNGLDITGAIKGLPGELKAMLSGLIGTNGTVAKPPEPKAPVNPLTLHKLALAGQNDPVSALMQATKLGATPEAITEAWNRASGDNSLTPEALIAWARSKGIEGYAEGTNNAFGEAFLAGENGPEMVVNSGSMKVLNTSDTKDVLRAGRNPNDGMVKAVQGVEKQLAEMRRELAESNSKTNALTVRIAEAEMELQQQQLKASKDLKKELAR